MKMKTSKQNFKPGREIKFRIISNNKISGYERIRENGWEWMWLELNPDRGERWTRGSGPEQKDLIRNQFTGLLDKTGKQIFEGDILKHINRSKITKKEYWFPIYKVVAEPFKFNLKHIGGGLCDGSWWLPLSNWNEMKIIGNIYENPELVTGAMAV